MICHICCEKHKDVLLAYKGLAVTKVTVKDSVKNGKCEELEVCDGEQEANMTNGVDHEKSVIDDDNIKVFYGFRLLYVAYFFEVLKNVYPIKSDHM
jgi:hypothetical protein